jgi:hypothetical protein
MIEARSDEGPWPKRVGSENSDVVREDSVRDNLIYSIYGCGILRAKCRHGGEKRITASQPNSLWPHLQG